ncbi:hypothetical protein CDAR_306011 [Caerostris darwini]|uniref:Uncharacterized protein n=1 Tax=Caerostris darwini TaxID=1538125 RepID=A0AAV4VSA0_9ARAC|nr:hypothetical protein CDAR_306011 [Caerostris darwini]
MEADVLRQIGNALRLNSLSCAAIIRLEGNGPNFMGGCRAMRFAFPSREMDQGGLEVRSDGHRPTVSLHLHIRLYRRHMRYLPASPFPLRPRETDRRDAVQGGSGTRHARNPLRVKAPSLLLSSLPHSLQVLQVTVWVLFTGFLRLPFD